MIPLLFILLASPTADLTPYPRTGFTPLQVHLVAELKGGEEVEAFYCPAIEWSWPDGTHSSEESDCPEWDQRDGYFPRRWSKDVVFAEGEQVVVVRWTKAGRLIATAECKVNVQGGGQ